jgi:hypothetical protein
MYLFASLPVYFLGPHCHVLAPLYVCASISVTQLHTVAGLRYCTVLVYGSTYLPTGHNGLSHHSLRSNMLVHRIYTACFAFITFRIDTCSSRASAKILPTVSFRMALPGWILIDVTQAPLTFYGPVITTYTTTHTTVCVSSAHIIYSIYLFRIIITISNDYFPKQH